MKKVFIVSMIMSLSIITSISLAQQATAPTSTPATPAATAPAPAAPAPAAPAPAVTAPAPTASLTISRMEIAGSVENREPVGTAASFPAIQEKVFCYVELKDVPKDSVITFVWTLGANEMGKVSQQVKKSSRWRTWSSKTISGMKGEWKVDVQDEAGAVLKSATFKVE